MQIADFFVSLKIKPDQASIARSDRFLKTFEKRILRSARRVEKSNVLGKMLGLNERKVSAQTQRVLDNVSRKVVFRINNFKINHRRLKQALDSVMRNNTTPLAINNFRINRASLRRSLEAAAGSIAIPVRVSGATGGRNIAPRNPSTPSTNRSGGRSNSRLSLSPRGVGFAAGGLGVFGGFGIAALNRTVTSLESMPVALESVTGSRQSADSQLAYLNRLGDEIGAPVMSLAPSYTKFLASAQGTKLEPFAQSGFRSLSRYGAVMGLDQEAMKGTFRAVEQMTNKQAIMAEELKGQLAERLPAAVRIMADVAAGGDTKKLFKMMEEGQLDPNVHLPLFFEALEAKAAGGWDAYTGTVRYQQNQSSKKFEDFIKIFAANGGQQGFFNMWKAFADTLPKLDSIAKGLGSAFESLGGGVQRLGNVLVLINDAFDWFAQQSPQVQDGILAISAAFALLATNIGRSMLPLVAAFLVLEDIASWRQGKKSITGMALGVDYNKSTTPSSIAAPNPYDGMPFGSVVEELRQKAVVDPTIFNKTTHALMQGTSSWYNGFNKLKDVSGFVLDSPRFFTPLNPANMLTGYMNWSEEADASAARNSSGLINNLTGLPNMMYGNSTAPLSIENVTINANTDNPEELGKRFIQAVEIEKASINMSAGEGAG